MVLQWLPKENLLSARRFRLADIAITELGVEEIRFTGGEPLVRADLVDIIPASTRRIRMFPLCYYDERYWFGEACRRAGGGWSDPIQCFSGYDFAVRPLPS